MPITNGFQNLALELADYFQEPKNFGMFAGLIKNNGQQKVREKFSEFKDLSHRKNVNSHYFLSMFRKNDLQIQAPAEPQP